MGGVSDHLPASLSQEMTPDAEWQTNCSHFRPNVSVTIKTKIRYNGQEYASPAQLPPEVRAAYESALHDGNVHKRFFNGHVFANEADMPVDARRVCDDVMKVIESNGEVTIPNGERVEPLLSKKEKKTVSGWSGWSLFSLVFLRKISP